MHDTKRALAQSNYYDPFKTTTKGILPYKFHLSLNGKITIHKTNGQHLIVSRVEVENILQRDDLDSARRRMYEAALEVWKKDEAEQKVQ